MAPRKKATAPISVGAPTSGGKDAKGFFLPGNQFWRARSSHGANPSYKTAEELWDACTQYFDWVEQNPLIEQKVFSANEGIRYANVAKMRAMTLGGLCLYIGICILTWETYRKERADLLAVVTRAEEIIRQQKFSGAAAELLNPNIIARDLGIVDKQDVTSGGEKLPAGGSVVVYLPAKEVLDK